MLIPRVSQRILILRPDKRKCTLRAGTADWWTLLTSFDTLTVL